MTTYKEVWKIGGSVLTGLDDYRHFACRALERLEEPDAPEQLFIVVSAQQGRTEKLLADVVAGSDYNSLPDVLKGKSAPGLVPVATEHAIASYLLKGEHYSARNLKRAFSQLGTKVGCWTQLGKFPLVAEGNPLLSTVNLDTSRKTYADLQQKIGNKRIIIVAGFGAKNHRGLPVLLGRNASDLVAATLTQLDSSISDVRFIKDVGAIFEDFQKDSEQAIRRISRQRLFDLNCTQVLDHRVLQTISCDFCIADRCLNPGTIVHLADTA